MFKIQNVNTIINWESIQNTILLGRLLLPGAMGTV